MTRPAIAADRDEVVSLWTYALARGARARALAVDADAERPINIAVVDWVLAQPGVEVSVLCDTERTEILFGCVAYTLRPSPLLHHVSLRWPVWQLGPDLAADALRELLAPLVSLAAPVGVTLDCPALRDSRLGTHALRPRTWYQDLGWAIRALVERKHG